MLAPLWPEGEWGGVATKPETEGFLGLMAELAADQEGLPSPREEGTVPASPPSACSALTSGAALCQEQGPSREQLVA